MKSFMQSPIRSDRIQDQRNEKEKEKEEEISFSQLSFIEIDDTIDHFVKIL